jgi:type IV secretion system protein VirD4
VTSPFTPPLWGYVTNFHHWFQQHQLEAYGGLAAVFAAGLVVKSLTRRGRQDLTSHGSARWATGRDVRQAGLSRAHGVVLGVLDGTVWLDDKETHDLLLAPSGSGKDAFHLNPTLQWGWTQSTLNLDCQNGQMYDATQQARAWLGNRVEAFAPYRRPLARINVLDAIRLTQPEEFRDALLIGRSLTAPEKMRQESSAGVHFRELAALTIAAGSLHLGYTTSQASLAAVWHFLTQHGTFPDVLTTMQQTAHTSHGVHLAIAEMSGMLGNIGSGDELGSAWSTTLRPLLLYLDPQVAASTDTSTITLDDLQYGSAPLSLYLLAESSSTLADMYQVYRVILDVTFACLMRHKPNTFGQRLLFVANELPSYGYMQAINKNASVMRKYGIKGLFVAQDLKQLEDVYGQEPELWSNTDGKIFHATGNDRTAKRVSEGYLGKETVEYLVESTQARGRRSLSSHRVGRPLLTPDEIGQLDPEKLLVLLRGQRPIQMTKYGYDHRFAVA